MTTQHNNDMAAAAAYAPYTNPFSVFPSPHQVEVASNNLPHLARLIHGMPRYATAARRRDVRLYGFAFSLVISDLSQAKDWERHVSAYHQLLNPNGAGGLVAADLVRRIAECVWEEARIHRAMNALLHLETQRHAVIAAGALNNSKKLEYHVIEACALHAHVVTGVRAAWNRELDSLSRRLRAAWRDWDHFRASCPDFAPDKTNPTGGAV